MYTKKFHYLFYALKIGKKKNYKIDTAKKLKNNDRFKNVFNVIVEIQKKRQKKWNKKKKLLIKFKYKVFFSLYFNTISGKKIILSFEKTKKYTVSIIFNLT